MSEELLRRQLYDSFKNRAILYYLIYDELRDEVGAAKAAEIMRRAIYERGEQIGKKYAAFAPNDFEGLKEAFLAHIPDEGRMFSPQVLRCDEGGLDIRFHRCPLKDAWLEARLPEEEVAAICRIAAAIDNGTFEAAGFEFTADTFQPGGDGCCYLHIRPGK
jgi:hypothetical protein